MYDNLREVPIQLFSGRAKRCGIPVKLLIAGSTIPAKWPSRVIELKEDDPGETRVDYGKTDCAFGPITCLFGHPEHIGSHGFLAFHELDERTFHIDAIAIPVKFFGSGIADLLMNRLERIARANGKSRLVLQTRDTIRAYGFFRRRHFYVTAEPNPFDYSSVEMTKHLPDLFGLPSGWIQI